HLHPTSSRPPSRDPVNRVLFPHSGLPITEPKTHPPWPTDCRLSPTLLFQSVTSMFFWAAKRTKNSRPVSSGLGQQLSKTTITCGTRHSGMLPAFLPFLKQSSVLLDCSFDQQLRRATSAGP